MAKGNLWHGITTGDRNILNVVELRILGGCADGHELFYFLFAEVNYGGQVVRKETGDFDDRPSPGLERGVLPGISVPGEEVARNARRLILSGMLRCWRISDDPDEGRGLLLTPREQTSGLYPHVEISNPDEREFAVYRGYDCVTFDEHMERFGYGPHEFRITRAGIDEIERPIYDEFE